MYRLLTPTACPLLLAWILILAGCDSSNRGAEATALTESAARSEASAVDKRVELPGVLVSADWLARKLSETGLVVINARTPEDYASGHVPGAINISYRETYDTIPGNTHNVAPVQAINRLFSQAGLDTRKTVVIYGFQRDYRAAARLFWVLEVHGHPAVAVLNGGLPAWEAAGQQLTSERETLPHSSFVAEFSSGRLADKLEVRRAMRDDAVMILDARDHSQYTGEYRKKDFKRYGHIPTAVNYPAQVLYVEGNDVCSIQDPKKLLDTYQELRGKRVFTYCNTGRSASVSYLALRAVGADVAVYDGAWTEWSADDKLPISQGDGQKEQP